jgi:hypothetical protein
MHLFSYIAKVISMYMKTFLCLLIPFLLSSTKAFDCRYFDFGATPEMILKGETATFISKENLAHNLKGISFVEHLDSASYMFTYTFHQDKLNGLKIKKISITGENTMINALADYKAAYTRYNALCGGKLVEKTDNGLKAFTVEQTNKKIFVNITRESEDFFLTENIIKK